MIHPIVIGTAGHIDHGKTSLVRALTGIDTDRLPIEKARGITTELGFARLDLGERRVAVVDVPGHERFVKSMVAGATGLDLVVLVIAADEGVMPQTREHLDICGLLGITRGVVALSKSDLVDGELRELAIADVRETPSRPQMSRCSRVCGITPSSAATTSTTRSMPTAPATIVRTKRSCPGTSTTPTVSPPGKSRWAKPSSMVMPRSFSSLSRSVSMPVSARTSEVLP